MIDVHNRHLVNTQDQSRSPSHSFATFAFHSSATSAFLIEPSAFTHKEQP